MSANVTWYNEARVKQPGSVILTQWKREQEDKRERSARAAVMPKMGRRDFAAGSLNRLTSGWGTTNSSINADLFRNLDTMRARSRELFQNNPYAKRFGGMVARNIVGANGVQLQARIYDKPDSPDSAANSAVEVSWDKWGKKGNCEVTGKLSWRAVQKLVIKTVARDGECLIRKIRGKSASNAFGYALQILDIDRLDTQLMRKAEKGLNEIRMGVELNEFGRPVNYWLRPYHPGDQWFTAGVVLSQHIVIEASEIIHVFITERPEQVRGIPWMHAAMMNLQNLGGYEEAAIIASRVGASKMGFFSGPDSDAGEDGEDDDGIAYTNAEPGEFGRLPEGTEFTPFDPDYPHTMFEAFMKACLRGVASGLDVANHTLANDLTDVNFSSIRSGSIDERDEWMNLQNFFIDDFVEPVFGDVLPSALAFGLVVLPNGKPLPLEKLDKFSAHTWQARRWQWVDPLKDMQANVMAIKNRIKSPQQVAAETGVELEDVMLAVKAAEDMADRIGIDLVAADANPTAPAKEKATETGTGDE